jgi:hypothetical protein
MAGKRGNPNWSKGKSGNPAGKKPDSPQLKGLIERCKEFVEAEGVDALIDLAKDTKDRKLQLAALIYITNRGFGSPTDKLSIEGKLTLEQLISGTLDKKEKAE